MHFVDHPERCPFLDEHPVPVCKAFSGGLRTPKEHELAELCRSSGHASCTWYKERKKLENRTA